MNILPAFHRVLRLASPALALGLLGAVATTQAADGAPGPSASAASAASADDPYLWLEQVDGERAMDWVRAENKKTLAELEQDPRFSKSNDDALAIVQAKDRIPNPSQLAGRIFNFWQDADHVRGLWRATSTHDFDAGGEPHWTTVLDLDQVAGEAKANWVWKGADCEATREERCLLSLSDGGEDAVTVREFDLKKAAFVGADGFELPKGKQASAWQGPGAILVSREWTPGELTTSGYPYVVKQLRRGQALSQAHEIFRGAVGDAGGVSPVSLSDATGHHVMVIEREVTTFETEHYVLTPAGPKKLGMPGKTRILDLYDGQLLVKVAEDWKTGSGTVPAGALVALDLKQMWGHLDELRPTVVYQPGPRQALASVAGTHGGLLVTTLDNVRGRAALFTHRADGSWASKPLPLPDNATLGIVDADFHTATAYLSAASYLLPSSLWRVDTAPGKPSAPTRIRSMPAKFDASHDVVEQLEATSSDGTKIPYFIIHPRDMKMDGSNPTILYAYGGFEVSITPSYSAVTGKLWLEHGGVYVVANIRGGGEFGPAWHEAGLKTKRQIIYDDFASVGRDLIARKITSPRRLGIEGGSNGGLLMGVEMTQHPELWNAVDIAVPLLDMIRFEQIAAGSSWVGEYGSMSVPEERAFWEKTSPYQALKRGVKYPKALVWTTTKDDRVGPQHARKFAARLQEYGIPYDYYEVIEGGHGAGANLKERAHTSAVEFTYFTRQLMD
ncbi:MAG TPA: prolyl oligopeptidase family serine peptidase [Burkholderiaceae bacterium]|nr:prolyl oligopeptidase family serine peptidase [Burkholderiaceae bacterium]